MRNNYEIAAEAARELFLNRDLDRIAERCRQETDAKYLRIRFLSRDYKIERDTGRVIRAWNGEPAQFSEIMAIYDFLCREMPFPPETGNYKAVHALSYAGTTSPSEGKLSAKTAAFLQRNLGAIDAALKELTDKPFPIGDHAAVFSVFDCMHAVFQFWEGDDEFPPNIRFLWDETAPTRLMFETLWYVMGCFEEHLIEAIEYRQKE